MPCSPTRSRSAGPGPRSGRTLAGWGLVAVGAILAALPIRGPFWILGSLCLSAGVAILAWTGARREPRTGICIVPAVLALLPLVGLRASGGALASGAWIVAGGALALAACHAEESVRRGLAWAFALVAAVSLLGVALVDALSTRVGSVFFLEIWCALDVGLLSPLRWSELAGPLGAMALPLVGGLVHGSRTRRERVLAVALGWLVALGLALGAHATSWVLAFAGVTWLGLHLGRRARRVGVALSVVAVAAIAILAIAVVYGPASRTGKVRAVSRGLAKAGAAWLTPASYVWRTDLATAGARPLAGNGLQGFPAAYGAVRAERWLPQAGVERPSTARCDVLQVAAECGLPCTLVLVAGSAWLLLRARRRDPYVSAALCAGLLGTLVGHAFAPVNGWALWLLLGLAAREDDAPAAPRAAMRLPLSLALVGVVLAGVALAVVTTEPAPTRETRGAALEARAAARPGERLALLERAAMLHALRWDAVGAGATHSAAARDDERHDYARFCALYAEALRTAGRLEAANAYEALREGLLGAAANGSR